MTLDTLAQSVARHQYGPHRCVGYFSEGTDRCIVNRLADGHDRLLGAIETEWYNGNITEDARDRLVALTELAS